MRNQKISLGLIIFSVIIFVTPNLIARADSLIHVNSNSTSSDTSVTTSKVVYSKTKYPGTLNNYVKAEVKNYMNIKGITNLSDTSLNDLTDKLTKAIDPKYADTKLEFLRVDKFRSVNKEKFNSVLKGKGILENQASAFINAAKKYNIDPVYFMAQSALETGFGTSNFSKGITISEIADTNSPIYENGALIGYKMIQLKKPVTVYNLFGIGAYDSQASFKNKTLILGTTYAYNHGWTTVPKAISGAAKFLSLNYLHNPKFLQNTPYKIRYISSTSNIWHQYSSDINYTNSLSSIMNKYKYLYNSNDKFIFDIPTFSK
ncbi:MAG: N-acetylglucosaminidase [Sarcina sp.]|uniref:N-acetylglucosaminidase n=1 Tax=Clostridium sp. TaxID=1506 RepID=UPI003F2D8BCE